MFFQFSAPAILYHGNGQLFKELNRQRNQRKVKTLVLILSARRTVDDRVQGLRAGGYDYLVKPFSFVELEARIEALIRRTTSGNESPDSGENETLLQVADLELDPWKHEARRAGEVISLQSKEFRLLELLMRNEGRVLTKTSILETVYEYNFDPQTNVVDVLVHRLRTKIDKEFFGFRESGLMTCTTSEAATRSPNHSQLKLLCGL